MTNSFEAMTNDERALMVPDPAQKMAGPYTRALLLHEGATAGNKRATHNNPRSATPPPRHTHSVPLAPAELRV